MDRRRFAQSKPPFKDDVAISWIEFNQSCTPARPFRRNQSRTAASKRVEDDIIAMRAVLDGVCNQFDRFAGRMHRQLLHTPSSEGVGTGVFPDICSGASMLA